MIDPKPKDIGRKVVYRPCDGSKPEEGVITTFNKSFVFVRYGKDVGAKATYREDLEWVR
jgi:hypothetical protein